MTSAWGRRRSPHGPAYVGRTIFCRYTGRIAGPAPVVLDPVVSNVCGVLGVASDRRLDAVPIDGMLDSLAHRGPDGRGLQRLDEGRVVLGHRRLAIIDRSPASAQPLTNEDGRIWLTFNGEIYNYRTLRRELVSRGHRFRSAGDSEVIVHAYEEWGEDCVRRFRGIFAFGLWDARSRRIVLARDAAGVKPLYYAQHGGRFYFASQPKAILGDHDFPRQVSAAAFTRYLALGYVPRDLAIFRHMAKLPAGHTAVYQDGRLRVCRFMSTDRPEPYTDAADARDAVDEALQDAVSAQLVADVPVGCFLSGGLDSSLLAVLATRQRPDLRSFTVGFEEAASDERAYARALAAHATTHHVEAAAVRGDLERTAWVLQNHFDEPFDLNGPLPFSELAGLARQHGTVVALGGDGADELFAGYLRYDDFDRPPTTWGASRLRALLRARGLIGARRADPRDAARYFAYEGCLPAAVQSRILGTAFAAEARDADIEWMRDLLDPALPAVGAAQRLDRELYLVDHILCKVDRASMAHGVETRVPYLDPAVVSAAARTPLDFHYRRGERKALLKQVARRHLPRQFVTSRKKGFSSPLGAWTDPAWLAWSDGLLRDGVLVGAGILRPDWQDRLRAATNDERTCGRGAWLLAIGELWARRWLGGSAPPSAGSTA